MRAILLAAGISSRLRPLTNDIPKALLPVGGTPLIARTLRALSAHGIESVVIVTGYRREKLEESVRSLRMPLDIVFVHNPEFATTNNNTSLWCSAQAVAGCDIILLDADILFHHGLLSLLISSPHENALIVRRSDHLGAEEIKVQLDASGAVKKIGKEVQAAAAAGESIGMEKFSARTAALLFQVLGQRRHRNEFYEASFQQMIDEGVKIFPVDSDHLSCIEIDTPEDLAAAGDIAAALDR